MGRRSRSQRRGRNPHFGNSWCEEFTTPRRNKGKQRHVDAWRKLDADGVDLGNLGIFLIDHRDTTAPLVVEVLGDFCRGISFEDVKKGFGTAGSQKTVWLDDRTSFPDLEGSGETRKYENPLTATGALRALDQPRFNHETLHDAARRLVYVEDLSPAVIYALAATASSIEVCAIRNAIYNHLAFEPCIAVKIPSAGFRTFQLELHLPFFILRKSPPPEKPHDKVNKKPDRGWTDLSFLKLHSFDSDAHSSEPNEVWSLQEAQISCVVTGTDDWRWTGYGFVDAEVDGLLAELSELEMSFDHVAAGEIEAKHPIRRPRDYWVKVFEIRVGKVTQQYQYMIHKLELAVKQYMDIHPSTLSQRPGNARDRTTEMKAAFDWALKMMSVLQRPHDVLLATVREWEAFNSQDGDIGYFYDPDADDSEDEGDIGCFTDSHADALMRAIEARYRSMQNIKKCFLQLEKYHGSIVALSKKCSNYQEALKLRLTLDKKEAADKSEFTSLFTLLFLYPVALAAAIFSMQQEAIPFQQSPKSFMLTVLILMIMVYVTQLLGKHALPWLRKTTAWWIERSESEDISKLVLGAQFAVGVKPGKGASQEIALVDEESITPKTLGGRTRTWTTSWGTATTVGPGD
ncbi:hypothetical protein DL95DRAFT_472141 [Leptodontidium sp. 2 PMI_412]|nr:hypothetical protein DL95DRAFT_472141 [Leptodontidium sp. 2 PMI_412]